MARTKSEEKAVTEKPPKKKTSVSEYHLKSSERTNKKSLDGRFQKTSNRSKRNRTYKKPEIYFGCNYFSKKQKNRASTDDRRYHNSEKHTLTEGSRRQINSMERDPEGRMKQKTENCTK